MAQTSSGQYYNCYMYVISSGSIYMKDQWTDNTNVATNDPSSGYDTTVYGMSAGNTDLNGEWDQQYSWNDGMDCFIINDTTRDNAPVEVSDVKIMFNGADVTNQTRDVIVGQQISLSLQVLPSTASASNIQWTVPETRVAGYIASSTNGAVTSLTSVGNNSVTFYWVGGGDGRQVSVSGTVNQRQFTKTVTFNVKRPTAQIFATFPEWNNNFTLLNWANE